MFDCVFWPYCLIVLIQLPPLWDLTIQGTNGIEVSPKQTLGIPNPGMYTHDKVRIQMTRFRPAGENSDSTDSTTKPAAVESKAIRLMNLSSPPSPDLPFQMGGLGLASTTQNRISLGALTKMEPVSSISLRPTEKSSNIELGWSDRSAVTAMSPTKQTARYEDVNVRVMGQSIDPRVIHHLTPDVSPFKARKLRKILAGSLDREWTSETAPRVLRQRGVAGSGSLTPDGITAASPIDVKLLNDVYNLNFTLRHDAGDAYKLNDPQIKFFRAWLIEKATCEMEFIWEDLGSLFWPRWIRRGVCLNKPNQSCSWPPGMKCQPSGSRALRLLHWKCEDAVQIQSRKRAAEQRNRRRKAVNTFHSRFLDMQPAQPDFVLPRIDTGTVSRLSLRDTHNVSPVNEHHMMRAQLRTPRWSSESGRALSAARGPINEVTREEKRKRRARRLIKRLSVTANGYHCYWQVQKYLISDRCACLCS